MFPRCAAARYDIDPESKLPRNPRGRTGVVGRGVHSRYGPNHSAIALVSRWLQSDGPGNSPGILEVLVLKKRLGSCWSLPEASVGVHERAAEAASRAILEQCLDSTDPASAATWSNAAPLSVEVYAGPVPDDSRDTDNAWGEVTVFNYHDSECRRSKDLPLDSNAVWVAFDPSVSSEGVGTGSLTGEAPESLVPLLTEVYEFQANLIEGVDLRSNGCSKSRDSAMDAGGDRRSLRPLSVRYSLSYRTYMLFVLAPVI